MALGLIMAFALNAPASAENTSAANHCARFGEDFVAVAGSDGCVRLGGHVRVKLSQGAAPMGYAPGDGIRNAAQSSHVRANPSLGLLELFAR